jgi:uncharacterized protein (TIGR03437 family)
MGYTETTNTSSAEVDTINTTNATQTVNTYSVELKARMQGGGYLFDQTYNVAFADPSIKAAITQAKNLLANSGAVSFTGPTELSSVQSLVSSATSIVQAGTQPAPQLVYGAHVFIGPQIIPIGDRGVCQSYTLDSNNYATLTGCAGGSLLALISGAQEIDTLILELVTINQTATTTNTYLTTQVYEIDGFTSALSPCDINQDGKTNVLDAQRIINEALGDSPPANDLNADGVVNAVDIQIVLNAVLDLGCSATVDNTAAVPKITALMNAANFQIGPISPGEVVALMGTALGSAGVQVLFDGTPAPLTYASATQINCVVPYEVSGKGNSVVQVRHQGGTSIRFLLTTADTTPALFTADGSGAGPAAALNQDGSSNSPGNPAAKGSTVVLFLTGEGQTSPPGMTGKVTVVSARTPQPVMPVSVLVGGQPATVAFYGEAPGVVSGVMQLTVLIPSNVVPGEIPISVSVGGSSSPIGVTVSVR